MRPLGPGRSVGRSVGRGGKLWGCRGRRRNWMPPWLPGPTYGDWELNIAAWIAQMVARGGTPALRNMAVWGGDWRALLFKGPFCMFLVDSAGSSHNSSD